VKTGLYLHVFARRSDTAHMLKSGPFVLKDFHLQYRAQTFIVYGGDRPILPNSNISSIGYCFHFYNAPA